MGIISFTVVRGMKGGVFMDQGDKILVPLDGSGCAETIIPRVEELITGRKTGICLLRVVSASTFPGVDPTEAQVKVVREAEEYLKGLENHFRARGLDVDTHVRYGNDAEEILDHAAQKEIGLVAMSTHGRSGVKRFFLGSVAEKVLRHAPKPVYLVRCAGSA
jgi:nucleotide-binding universal stress UspA family protein